MKYRQMPKMIIICEHCLNCLSVKRLVPMTSALGSETESSLSTILLIVCHWQVPTWYIESVT